MSFFSFPLLLATIVFVDVFQLQTAVRLKKQQRALNSSGAEAAAVTRGGPAAFVTRWNHAILEQTLREIIIEPEYPDVPVLMLVNRKSGGQYGDTLLEDMNNENSTSNPTRIPAFALPAHTKTPQAAMLKMIAQAWRKRTTARLICAGGDGTSSWCFGVLANLILKNGGGVFGGDFAMAGSLAMEKYRYFKQFLPAFVMCPMGTGNDLARSSGWGKTYPGAGANIAAWIENVKTADRFMFDIWRVTFSAAGDCGIVDTLPGSQCGDEENFRKRDDGSLEWVMFLYASTGFDAEIIRRFVRRPSQIVNYLEHGSNGMRIGFGIWWQRIRKLWQEGAGIGHTMTDEGGTHIVTKAKAPYHKGTSVDIMNVPTIAGGGFLWGRPGHSGKTSREGVPFHNVRMNDGRIEVLSSPHPVATVLGQTVVRQLSREGQPYSMDLTWNDEPPHGRPFQVDGECLICSKGGHLSIRYGGSIQMLQGRTPAVADAISPMLLDEELPEIDPVQEEYAFEFPGSEHMEGE